MIEQIETLITILNNPLILRAFYILLIGIGARVIIRYLMHLIKIKKSVIYEQSRKIVVPIQVIASFHNCYVYRFKIVPVNISENGIQLHENVIHWLRFERVLSEGIMFSAATICLYYFFMIAIRVVEKKFKISIISLTESK